MTNASRAPHAVHATFLTPAFKHLMLMQSAFGFAWSLFFLLPKFLAVELHATASQIGLVSAVAPASGALLIPVLGRVIDQLGRRPVIVAGTASVLVFALGFQFVDRIGPLLFALQVLQGAAFTLTFNGAATLAADLAPPERLGQAMGVFGASNVAMNAVAPATAEFIEVRYGWPWAFAASAVAASIALALAFRVPAAGTCASRPAVVRTSHSRTPLSLLLYDMAVMTASGAGFATVFTFYQPFALQLGIRDMSGFFIGFTTAVLVMRLGLGSTFDRMGRARVAAISGALYVLVVLAMSELVPGMLALLGAFMGIAHGVFYPTMNALALEGAEPEERGRVTVFFNGGFQLGYAACVVALGPLADLYGYPLLFAIGAGCSMVSLVLVLARGATRAWMLSSAMGAMVRR